jgi:hypothetical protein
VCLSQKQNKTKFQSQNSKKFANQHRHRVRSMPPTQAHCSGEGSRMRSSVSAHKSQVSSDFIAAKTPCARVCSEVPQFQRAKLECIKRGILTSQSSKFSAGGSAVIHPCRCTQPGKQRNSDGKIATISFFCKRSNQTCEAAF